MIAGGFGPNIIATSSQKLEAKMLKKELGGNEDALETIFLQFHLTPFGIL